jgi:hypothetical protein
MGFQADVIGLTKTSIKPSFSASSGNELSGVLRVPMMRTLERPDEGLE